MGNLPAKQLGNGTKAIVNKNQMIMKSNNMVTKPPMLNNIQKASYKTISRTTTNAKTIKTLSPQSPQSYAPKSGIKTLSPQNHMGKVSTRACFVLIATKSSFFDEKRTYVFYLLLNR